MGGGGRVTQHKNRAYSHPHPRRRHRFVSDGDDVYVAASGARGGMGEGIRRSVSIWESLGFGRCKYRCCLC